MPSTFLKLAVLMFVLAAFARAGQTTNQQITANLALYNAVIRNNAPGCVAAIGQGAQVNSVQRGDTMLITAVRQGLPVTECLVEHGAAIEGSVTEQGNPMTPIWAAAQAKHFDVVEYLVKKGATINRSDGQESLLMFTIAHGKLDEVKFLVEHGADVNYVRRGVRRPENALSFALGLHHSDEVEYLKAHGAHELP